MKNRTAVHILIGFLVAFAVIFVASSLQAGSAKNVAEMFRMQRRMPTLWVVDLCALGMMGAVWWHAAMLNHFQSYLSAQAKLHHDQMYEMVDRAGELEHANDEFTDRMECAESELTRQRGAFTDQLTTLQETLEGRMSSFETETRRQAEQNGRLFHAQWEQNARQMEAMDMALQFQRGELRRLRHEVRELQNQAGIPAASYRVAAEEYFEPLTVIAEQKSALTHLPEQAVHARPFDAALETSERAAVDGVHQPEIAASAQEPAGAMAATAEAETCLSAFPTAQAGEPLQNQEDAQDPGSLVERQSDWKAHVDRLFHEAKIVENMPPESFEAVVERTEGQSSLRIINNEEGSHASNEETVEEPKQADLAVEAAA